LNQPITNGGAKSSGRNKLNGTVYYPLGQKDINLFAYTGNQIAENGSITLTAGTTRANDVLLGKGTDNMGNPISGNSDDPIEYITFKHLMTRVDVKIEVAGDVEPTKPTSIDMRFTRTGTNGPIVDRGTYNVFNGGNATNGATAEFAFSGITTTTKTHYLVPNGTNLTTYPGQIFSSLIINDYTATTEDLAALKFSKAIKGTEEVDFVLNPGLAYDLTFVINRLKIVEIKLTLKDWDTKSGTAEWGYVPKTMTLSTGSDYTINEDSKITKMVLKYKHTDDKVYQYIGQGKLDGTTNKIDFVTLPANLSAGTLTADLYTEDGLLAYGMEIVPSGSELSVLNLGKYGMKKRDDGVLEISTPLQLALMVNDASKTTSTKYELVNDIDMDNTGVTLVPTAFPAGSVLDGKGHDILHINIDGNGLFTINNGTLKNFRIASGWIKGNGTGAIGAICQTNNGQIEAVVNQIDIQPATGQTIAGGLTGVNATGGIILAAVNTGNVLGGVTVGGITGQNQNTAAGAIKACINVGMLNKNATNLGGICGTSLAGASSDSAIVNTCYWLTGTARKNQAVSNDRAIGNNPTYGVDAESADLAASSIRSSAKIAKLTGAASTWKFELDETKSSWPIAKPL